MRITGLEVTFVTIPFTRPELWAWGERKGVTSAVIELHTDAGVSGIGEAIVVLGPTPPIVLAVLRRMEELVIGEAPNRVEFLTAKILGQGAWHSFRETAFTCWAGIEMACWDIVGKTTGLSVCELLGGPIRQDVPAMFYVYGSPDIAEMVEYAREGIRRGFGTIYVKVGIEEERDIELVARVREAIGPKPKLRVDANEAWAPGTAVRILGRMRPYVIEYAEQPTLMFDLDGLAHVRRTSGVPVAANQSSWGAFRILDLIKRGACDVLMTDPHQEGGSWRSRRRPRSRRPRACRSSTTRSHPRRSRCTPNWPSWARVPTSSWQARVTRISSLVTWSQRRSAIWAVGCRSRPVRA